MISGSNSSEFSGQYLPAGSSAGCQHVVQLVGRKFSVQHVQLVTALAQLRTGADHRFSILTMDEVKKKLWRKKSRFLACV